MSQTQTKGETMTRRHTLLEEIFVEGVRSPVTRKILLDLAIALLPLLMIAIARG